MNEVTARGVRARASAMYVTMAVCKQTEHDLARVSLRRAGNCVTGAISTIHGERTEIVGCVRQGDFEEAFERKRWNAR